MLIDLKNVNFSYEDALILQDVSLTIKKGEFIGIFGPNGGGKTTLLNLIMGFLKPNSGQISIMGTTPKAVRGKMGYVPQVTNLDKAFPISVAELVSMGCLSHLSYFGTYSKNESERIEEALKTVGLLEKKNAAFGTLSGGQLQRALIARALINEPEILLLDEPTANIDSEAEEKIYHILNKLKGSTTILMVSHNLHAMTNHVDRAFCVNHKVSCVKPNEICQHFAFGLYHDI